MSQPEGMASRRRISALERSAKALELKKEGATYDEIAAALGCTKSTAHRAVMRALERIIAEPAEDVKKLELARLDRMLRPLWRKIVDEAASLADVVRAVDASLRIMDRRAKYLGLDAPIKIDWTKEVYDAAKASGLSDDDAAAAVAEAEAIARQLQTKGGG